MSTMRKAKPKAQLLPAARVTLSENRSRGFLVSSGFGGFPRSVCFVGNRLPSDLSLVVPWPRFDKLTRFVDGGHPAGAEREPPLAHTNPARSVVACLTRPDARRSPAR